MELEEESQLCAGGNHGQDACNGDSGGPLIDIATGTQIGIVSLGVGCGIEGVPAVYSRISTVADWIDEQVCVSSPIAEQQSVFCQNHFRVAIQININYNSDDNMNNQISYNLFRHDDNEDDDDDDANEYFGRTFEEDKYRDTQIGARIFRMPEGTNLHRGVNTRVLHLIPGSYTFEIRDRKGWGEYILDYSIVNYNRPNDIVHGDSNFQSDRSLIPFVITTMGRLQSPFGETDDNANNSNNDDDDGEDDDDEDDDDYDYDDYDDDDDDDDISTNNSDNIPFRGNGNNGNDSNNNNESTGLHDLFVDIIYDFYAGEVRWTLTRQLENDRFSVNELIYVQDYGTVSEPGLNSKNFKVPNGNYQFTITDANQDGICCNNGAGYIDIYELGLSPPYEKMELARHSGDYAFSATLNFELN